MFGFDNVERDSRGTYCLECELHEWCIVDLPYLVFRPIMPCSARIHGGQQAFAATGILWRRFDGEGIVNRRAE